MLLYRLFTRVTYWLRRQVRRVPAKPTLQANLAKYGCLQIGKAAVYCDGAKLGLIAQGVAVRVHRGKYHHCEIAHLIGPHAVCKAFFAATSDVEKLRPVEIRSLDAYQTGSIRYSSLIVTSVGMSVSSQDFIVNRSLAAVGTPA